MKRNQNIGIAIVALVAIISSALMLFLSNQAIEESYQKQDVKFAEFTNKNEELLNKAEVIISEIENSETGERTIVVTRNIQGTKGDSGSDGSDGKDGKDGSDGIGIAGQDGQNATPEQIAVAVAEYLKANPPKQGKDGKEGERGEDGRNIELCYTPTLELGQRFVGTKLCAAINKPEVENGTGNQ